jgi:hypothetical protein
MNAFGPSITVEKWLTHFRSTLPPRERETRRNWEKCYVFLMGNACSVKLTTVGVSNYHVIPQWTIPAFRAPILFLRFSYPFCAHEHAQESRQPCR